MVDVVQDFENAVRAAMKSERLSEAEAFAHVARTQKDLHESYLRLFNFRLAKRRAKQREEERKRRERNQPDPDEKQRQREADRALLGLE